jgi:hypothetical protein
MSSQSEELRRLPNEDVASKEGLWPRISSIADLGRILVILHGASAPSDATLKKWSASGEFRECLAGENPTPEDDGHPERVLRKGASTHARPGRPGLHLVTDKAISRVYELWPQLADSDPKAVFEQAVARTVRQLAAAIRPLIHDTPATRVAPIAATASEPVTSGHSSQEKWQQRIEQTLSALSQDVKDLRREMAQFTALRNNLITRLDEVVARSRESLLVASKTEGGASDPIVEARRDRDMGVLKSTIDQILSALERMEAAGRSH